MFALLAATIIAAGHFYGVALHRQFGRQWSNQLAGIAELKAEDVARWRRERTGDARIIGSNPMLPRALALARAGALPPDLLQAVRSWIGEISERFDYREVVVFDARGEPLAGSGTSVEAPSPALRARIHQVLDAPGLVWGDIELDAHGEPTLDLLAPVDTRAPIGTPSPGTGPLGVLLLRINPAIRLFPELQGWPGRSVTGETILVRDEDAGVRVLTPLRHDTAPALKTLLPVTKALADVDGVLDSFRDYRGVSAVGVSRPVPDTPWRVLAKVDLAEVHGELRTQALAVLLIALLGIALAGAAVVAWWRGQRRAFERAHREAAIERELLARQLDLLTRYGNDIVLLLECDGRVLDANDRAVAAYGLSREALVGGNIRDLRAPETRPQLGEQLARAVEDSAQFETWHCRADGAIFPVEVSARSVLVGGKHVIQSIIRDITERRAAEDALRQSEAKFRAAFEQTSVGVALVDACGRAVSANRAFQSIVGRTEVELRQTSVGELASPEESARVRRLFVELVDGTRDSYVDERRLHAADGSLRSVTVRANAIRDGAGAFRLAVVQYDDVTDRLSLEAKLRISERMAALGTLAAGVAHEINNPLAYVTANLRFALDELAEDHPNLVEMRAALTEASEGATRVSTIVRELRTFSREEREQPGPVELDGVVRSAIALAQNELRHHARLVTELAETPPVLGTEHRLTQVVVNLLVNAAQSLPDGRADENTITVRTRFNAGRSRVELAVSDTGCGIPPENLGRIFEPFFTTKAVGVGTGLGLSVCHGIVAGLGGEIVVESMVGAGSTFRVLLPATASAAALAVPPEPAPARAPAKLPAARVAVVDDEPLIGRAVARVLEPQHDVAVFGCARELLAALDGGQRFDALLLDMMMPEMTGMELFDRLRVQAPALADRTAFLTGGIFTDYARAFLARCAQPHIEKPFEPDALRRAVAALVDVRV